MVSTLFGCYIFILKRCNEKVSIHTKILKDLRVKQGLTSELFQQAKARELAEQIASEEEQIAYALDVFNNTYELLNAMED